MNQKVKYLVHKTLLESEYRKLANKLKRKLKRVLKIPLFKKKQLHKALLLDVDKMFPLQGLIEFLIQDDWKSIKEYKESVNAWLELEQIAFDYDYKLLYKIGEIEKTIKLVLLHHKLVEQKEQIFNEK